MRLIRQLFVIFCLLATGLTVWGLVYARKEGFTSSWRHAIEREFEKHGYHVEIGKITLGAFRGLVAEDVRFFLGPERKEETALIDDVFLDVSLEDIFSSKKISVNTLDIQDAMLLLPVDPGDPTNEARLRIDHLSGRIEVTESIIQIVKAEAEISGMVVSLKGSLLRPPGDIDQEKEESDEEKTDKLSKSRKHLQRVFQEIAQYEFLDGKPTLQIDFRGDLRDLATTTATVKLEASRFRKKGNPYEIAHLDTEVRFDGRRKQLEVSKFFLRDQKGDLRIDANWSQKEEKIGFKLDSSVDLPRLSEWYLSDKRLGEIVFYQAPKITAEGFISLEKLRKQISDDSEMRGFYFPGEVLGEVHFDKFVSRGTVFSGLDCGYSLADDRFYIRNLRLDHKTGVAFLNMKFEPGRGDETVQYQAEVKLDPVVFRPFFKENGRRFIDLWHFDESSTVYLAAVGQGADMNVKHWKNKGVVDLRNFKLHGVSFQELETDFETDRELQYFRNVKMTRHDGSIVTELAQHNVLTKQWEVNGVVFNTDLIEGSRAFSPSLAKTLSRYKLTAPPTIRLSGSIDGRRKEVVGSSTRNTDIRVEFECRGDLRTEILGQMIRFTSPVGKVKVEKDRVHLTSMDAGVFGGRVLLEYDGKNVRSAVKPYDVTIRGKGLELESIIRLYKGSNSVKGTLNADLNLSGNVGVTSSVNGHATANISDGDLFGIPIFGPLSKLVTDATPKQDRAGYSIARRAKGSFQFKKGVIFTKDLQAETQAFQLKSAGSVNCNDGTLNIDATAYYRFPVAGAIMSPVSELLTYSGTGTVSNPVWEPKHISGIVKLPGQIVTGVGEIPVKGLQMIGRTILGPNQKDGGKAKPESEAGSEGTPAGKPGAGTEKAEPVKLKLKLDNLFKQGKSKEGG